MTNPSAAASATNRSTRAALQLAFDVQRGAFRSDPNPSYEVRRERLERLIEVIEKNEEAFVSAISADFGHRAPIESRMLDVTLPIGEIKETMRQLRHWMAPRSVGTRLHLRPAHSKIIPQPLGVVGVISPWNFPLYLAFGPITAALAAGNRVMLKPSELTPRTSERLAQAFGEAFSEAEVKVILGDAEVGKEFSSLPFDHLLFTGSTNVGRMVARAAAENLTPITLELGGKSPAVITPSEDPARAAPKIVYGKMVNAGQICVAPDYVLCPRAKVDAFVEATKAAAARFFPTLGDNPDYTSIVSDRHYARLKGLIRDALEKGAEIIEVNPAGETLPEERRKLPLTLVLRTTDEMKLMREEIFGPVLPVIPYDSLEDAIALINDRDRPLALYVFSSSDRERDEVLTRTVSGGVTVNDTLWHVANDAMPFGGVGPSGMGAYHGQAGFDTFSKLKPVFYQPSVNAIFLFHPPYGRVMEMMAKTFRRLL